MDIQKNYLFIPLIFTLLSSCKIKKNNAEVKNHQSDDFIIGSSFNKSKKTAPESEEMKKLNEELSNSYENHFHPKSKVKLVKHKKS